MKLIVGLGNPGNKYQNNRHNAGFMVVDKLAKEYGSEDWSTSKKGKLLYTWMRLGDEKVELIKPQTLVNGSGFSVAYARRKHSDIEIEDIYVIHDDLDIKLGQYKIQKGKGPKIHKGLLSIYERLGTPRRQGYGGQASGFWHVRVGVENRKKPFSILNFKFSKKIPGERYVLQNFMDKELEILKTVVDRIVKELIRQLNN